MPINVDEDPRNAGWVRELAERGRHGRASYRINGEVPTMGSIILVPASPEDWTVEGGEEAEALHVTLKYLGPADNYDEEARSKIERIVGSVAYEAGEFYAEVSEQETLGPKNARVLVLESEKIDRFRQALVDRLSAEEGLVIPIDAYPTFLAHMTLSYGEADLDEFVGDVVIFDRVRVCWGSEYAEYG